MLKGSLLPQRVVFGIMGFFAGVVIFMMRSCLPVAITQMVVPVNHLESANRNDSLVCRFETSFVANITTKSVVSAFDFSIRKVNKGSRTYFSVIYLFTFVSTYSSHLC